LAKTNRIRKFSVNGVKKSRAVHLLIKNDRPEVERKSETDGTGGHSIWKGLRSENRWLDFIKTRVGKRKGHRPPAEA